MKKIKGYDRIAVRWRKTEKDNSISSTHAASLLLTISIMGIWLVSMVILTVVAAQEIYDRLYERSQNFTDSVGQDGLLSMFYDDDAPGYGYQKERPDYLEHQMFRTIYASTSTSESSGGYYDTSGHSAGKERHKLIRDISFPMETAVLFYDADGNLLHGSESDVMYFNYYTQEEWDAGEDTTVGLHYGWIDLSEGKNTETKEEDRYLYFRTICGDRGSLSDIQALRVTGYFEGTELIPVVMHYTTKTDLQAIAENDDRFSTGTNSYSYIISDVDRTGKLEWKLQFDRSAEYEGKDLVTVYLTYLEMWDYENKSVEYDGKEYENLADLTETMDLAQKDSDSTDFQDKGIYELNELLVFDKWSGTDTAIDEGTTDFYMVTAVRSNPLSCAISALRNIYIVTGLLALALLLMTRNALKKHLIRSVAE